MIRRLVHLSLPRTLHLCGTAGVNRSQPLASLHVRRALRQTAVNVVLTEVGRIESGTNLMALSSALRTGSNKAWI